MRFTRRIALLVPLLVCGALSAAAADIDGDWLVTRTTQKGEVQFTITLKADGSNLTGTCECDRGGRVMDIADGKVDGDSFSFTTTQNMKQGAVKIAWKGTVSGDSMKGETGLEGRRTRPFTGKRK